MNRLAYAIVAAAAIVSASCSSHRSPLTYFTDVETMAAVPTGDYQVKIEPSDELLINVTSEFPDATADFNVMQPNPATSATALTSAQPRLQTYIVDTKGDIIFPKLGAVHVQGLTTEQLRDELTKRISEYVENPQVKVELVNFVVNVAGEVKEPGRVQVTTERFSVLDALTSAGDLTPYGNRDNVMIVREENGQRKAYRLDLNKAETLASPYFYLKQNDYVYVEPSKVRKDNADYNQNNSYKLQVVATIVSATSVVASLIIALTR